MRVTRKSYEKACATVAAAREQLKLVKVWEDTVRQLGNLGNQQLVALTVNEDGSIQTECKLLHGKESANPTEPNLASAPHRSPAAELSNIG